MVENNLLLEDWKMAKDRIKHFDDTMIKIRIQGIPIATAIFAIGATTYQYIHNVRISIPYFSINASALVILIGTMYLIPIFALDMFHYKLLTIAVKRAREIESDPLTNNQLQITTRLTSPMLTWFHTLTALFLYVALLIAGIMLTYVVNLN